jgi:hypothetical protein
MNPLHADVEQLFRVHGLRIGRSGARVEGFARPLVGFSAAS